MFQVPSFALKIQFGLARLRGFNSLDKLFNFFLVNDFQGQKSLYGKGVKPELLILLQNPPSQNREDLSKTVSGAVGIGNNPKIVS